MSDAFYSDELFACHIPAIELLVNLGYHFLTPKQLMEARGGRLDNVLLEGILRSHVSHHNRIQYKKARHSFSEANITNAIERLKAVRFMGLLPTNAMLYDLLTLGVTLEQSVEGDSKSFTFHFIDWEHVHNNQFHVAVDYRLERWQSRETLSVDLLLFVNGIPFVAIECCSSQYPLQRAQENLMRSCVDGNLGHLFVFVQIMLALNGKEASYAPVGPKAGHWAYWREAIPEAQLQQMKSTPLPDELKIALFDLAQSRLGMNAVAQQERPVYQVHATNQQEQVLAGICRPERLLHLVRNYSLFDGGTRKMVWYHQFLAVQKALDFLEQRHAPEPERNGLILQAQGAGKTLTMIFLARQLAERTDLPKCKIVLVSSRRDLGVELDKAFAPCHVDPIRAKSSRELLAAINSEGKSLILTRHYNQLAPSAGFKKNRSLAGDIFFLIDEDQRQPLGLYTDMMRKIYPNACFIGFAAMPLRQDEYRFPVIDVYQAQQARRDQLLVPIVVEERDELINEPQQADAWLARQARDYQIQDKEKLQYCVSARALLPAPERHAVNIALDVSTHYRNIFRGSGLKGQLIAPDNRSALYYKKWFDQIGFLDSALVLSNRSITEELGPGYAKKRRKDGGMVGAEEYELLHSLWHNTIALHGNEDEYHRQIIRQFINNDKPELFIVVDELIDGFSVERNAVLYLARPLPGHTLLQAVARVNRAAPGLPKPVGQVIDYSGNFAPWQHHIPEPHPLAGFHPAELEDCFQSADSVLVQLPACHAQCWAMFPLYGSKDPDEHYERELSHPNLRAEFGTRLLHFVQILHLALGNAQFLKQCPEHTLMTFQQDALRFFRIKLCAQLRYGEIPAMSVDEVLLWHKLHQGMVVPEINLFDPGQFFQTLEQFGLDSTEAKADALAHHLQRYLAEIKGSGKEQRALSRELKQTMLEFQRCSIDAPTYLDQTRAVYSQMLHAVADTADHRVDQMVVAIHDLILPWLHPDAGSEQKVQWAVAAAHAMVASWQQQVSSALLDNSDQFKQLANEIDDYLCDVMEVQGQLQLSGADKEALIDSIVQRIRQGTAN